MKIYLVVPSLNEGRRLRETIEKAREYIPENQIVVIDDASRVPEKLPSGSCWLLRHKINLGKGAAMITGAEFAFSKGADAVIFMDADCQHNPKEIPMFVKQLNTHDLVFGCRHLNSKAPLVRVIGNRLANIYVKLVFGISISDILSGFRGLNQAAYKYVKWQSSRYGVETEMIARLGKYKKYLTWTEIPIETIYIDKYKGVTAIDAIKLLISSISWKLS